MIGLVFPIYDFKAPQLINDLVSRIEGIGSKYIFAVCTYGVMPLDTMKKLEKEIGKSGGKLSRGFAIHLPHNGLGYDRIPAEKKRLMFRKSKERTVEIAEYVRSGKEGLIEAGSIKDRIKLGGILLKISPKLFPMVKQAVLHGMDSLGFSSDEKCNSCGTCASICPVKNIELKDVKPLWGKDCVNCFACIHWCPQEAIQIARLTGKMERYHHPDITISDISGQE